LGGLVHNDDAAYYGDWAKSLADVLNYLLRAPSFGTTWGSS